MIILDKSIQSRNYSVYGGVVKQTVKTAVCMHKTVGAFNGAINWMRTTPEQREAAGHGKTYSSCHTIDDRNNPGVINQIMGFDKRAWHAGGVVRRTQRAMNVIGVRDPNNVSIGHEMAAYYDINRDGHVSAEEKKATLSQLDDFVDLMFFLEEESKTNKWVDIKADADHLFTHYDLNPGKPNMEWEHAYVVEKMAERKAGKVEDKVEHTCPLALKDSNLKQTVTRLLEIVKK